MEDYKKLVNRLREEPKDSRKAVLSIYDLCVDAACAIESLLDKLKHAEAERDIVTKRMIELEQDVCRLKSRLAAYEDTGLGPEEIKELRELCTDEVAELARTLHRAIESGEADHLRDLLQAENEGRLVVLPCKVGDHVWADGREAIVVWFLGYKTERYLHAQFLDNAEYTDIPFYEIGKTVFLTREEAEAALKGGEG